MDHPSVRYTICHTAKPSSPGTSTIYADNRTNHHQDVRHELVPGLQTRQEVLWRAPTKQLVSAAGEGATAALMIGEYLRRIHEERSAAHAVERDVASMASAP